MQKRHFEATSINQKKNFNKGWFVWALLSVLPVLFISYLCIHYVRAELLLHLFLIEWVVVLAIWRFLCPWLGRLNILWAAVPFLLSFVVASLITREILPVNGAVWFWSDDWWYIQKASLVVDSLYSSGWNLFEAWLELTSVWVGSAWTTAGWPFVLGVVASLFSSNASPEILHAISLSLNATFLSIIMALIYYVIGKPSRNYPGVMLFFFLLLICDPIVYSAMSRKETILQLSLILTFVMFVKLSDHIRLQWIIFGFIGFLGILTNRPAYIPLILFSLYYMVLGKIHLNKVIKIGISIILVIWFLGAVMDFQIREKSISDLIKPRTLKSESGLAMAIYNIPVLGPTVFYAISPVPPLPWKIFSQEFIIITIIRSFGSIAWFFSACYVLRGVMRNKKIIKNRLFTGAAIMFMGVFIAVILYADDPRYKQPTNFFLCILLFLTWYDKKMRRIPSHAKRKIS